MTSPSLALLPTPLDSGADDSPLNEDTHKHLLHFLNKTLTDENGDDLELKTQEDLDALIATLDLPRLHGLLNAMHVLDGDLDGQVLFQTLLERASDDTLKAWVYPDLTSDEDNAPYPLARRLVAEGPVQAVEALLRRWPNALHPTDPSCPSLLMDAVSGANVAMVILVLPFSDPAATNPQGQTALHLAVKDQHLEMFNLLRPVSPLDTVDDRGDTPLRAAVEIGHRDMVAALIHTVRPEDRLHLFCSAVMAVDEPLLDLLEQHLGPLHEESVPAEVGSCLHRLAYSNSVFSVDEAVVYRMVARVRRPGDESLRNRDGLTPLMVAVQAETNDVVDALLDGMTSQDMVHHRSSTGGSVLELLCWREDHHPLIMDASGRMVLAPRDYPTFLDALALLEEVTMVRAWVAQEGIDPAVHMPRWHRHNETLVLADLARPESLGVAHKPRL